jgi:hypothetical protein
MNENLQFETWNRIESTRNTKNKLKEVETKENMKHLS